MKVFKQFSFVYFQLLTKQGQRVVCGFFKDYRIKIKNKFFKNEDIEIITPSEKFITQVTEIKTMKGEELELANTNDDLWVKFAKAPLDYEYAMARTVGIKGNVNEVQKCSCGD